MNESFCIVARDGNTLQGTIRHPTVGDASQEALRLAAKGHGRFYVLQMVGYAQPAQPPARWVSVNTKPPTTFYDQFEFHVTEDHTKVCIICRQPPWCTAYVIGGDIVVAVGCNTPGCACYLDRSKWGNR